MKTEEFKIQVLPLKNKLFRFALRILGKVEEAEDSVQDVMLKLWTNREQLKNYNNIEAFAMVVTRNQCLDRLKSKDHKNLRPEILKPEKDEETPYVKAEMSDTMQKVHKIINALPDQQKMIIQMRDVEGMDFEEIADVMEMNVNAVRVNLSRARKKVRDTLLKLQNYELSRN